MCVFPYGQLVILTMNTSDTSLNLFNIVIFNLLVSSYVSSYPKRVIRLILRSILWTLIVFLNDYVTEKKDVKFEGQDNENC